MLLQFDPRSPELAAELAVPRLQTLDMLKVRLD